MNVQLLQLPLHPGTGWEPTGNVPLAPARLAAAAGLPPESVFPQPLTDTLGDRGLLEELSARDPGIIGATLYLWNRERTLHILREYKRLHPGVMVVAGGPEVTPDNRDLLTEGCIDLFVSGEGEERAAMVLDHRSLSSLIAAGARYLPAYPDESPPERWPDPYETGHLVPEPGGSAHVETQRGCGCSCIYCAYRRTAPVPRISPVENALKRMRIAVERGASELVFLDPTFNARADLLPLLQGMESLKVSCFGEIRGDLVAERHPEAFRRAGFSSLEVGLQTMDAQVLREVGRGGDPARTVSGAAKLQEAGVTPVVDLILGLPGDDPKNVARGAMELRSSGVGEQVQIFCLSVLPGTSLRARAPSLGIQYMDSPPYIVTRSGKHTIAGLLEERESISDILGYDADPPCRPVLCDDYPGMERFDPLAPSSSAPPSVRHGVLRIVSRDPWKHRSAILERLALRRETDPFCPLDLVLETSGGFPLDLLDHISSIPAPDCYDTAKADIYGLQPLLRTAVIAEEGVDAQWLLECSRLSVTVLSTPVPRALPGGRTGVLIGGSWDLSELEGLYRAAPELVFFRNGQLERLWNLEVLGLG